MTLLNHLTNDKDHSTRRTILVRGIVGIGFLLMSMIPMAIIGVLLAKVLNVDIHSLFQDYDVATKLTLRHSKNFAILYITLIAPIYEELSYRLGLSFKKWHIAISCGALTFFFLNWFTDISIYSRAAIGVTIILLMGLLVKQKFGQNLDQKYKNIIIIISILGFGLSHLINYSTYEINAIPLYLLMLIPPIWMGAIMTYYRLNLGFIYGLLLHILINGGNMLFTYCL